MVRPVARALLCLAVALPAAAWASAEIQSLSGDVRLGNSKQLLIAGKQGQRLASGTTIVTGADSQAVLKFDDGGQMVLGQNTEFRIVDSQYSRDNPGADRGIFDLVRGALRVVSGAIGSRNRQAWALRAPQVTIGLRGTDFMVVVVNPVYLSVSHGAIAVSNGYGTSVLGAGSIATVASSESAVAMISASSLPAPASTAFASMAGAPGVVAGGSAVGAGAAGGVAAGGIGAGTMAIGIGAAAAALAAGGKSGSSSATHH
jgi:hypothetical protein